MGKLSSLNLTPEQWPYGDTHIIVLSNTLNEAPDNLRGKVTMVSDEVSEIISQLKNEGYQHAYIDGGATITSFINLQLINEMTITRAPVLLGEGKPLFGNTYKHITLHSMQRQSVKLHKIQLSLEALNNEIGLLRSRHKQHGRID